MDKEIILELFNKLPSWFIMLGVGLYGINKICGNSIYIIIRLIAKHNARKDRIDRLQNEKIEMVLEELRSLRSELPSHCSELKINNQ
jgi:hypothetical protein